MCDSRSPCLHPVTEYYSISSKVICYFELETRHEVSVLRNRATTNDYEFNVHFVQRPIHGISNGKLRRAVNSQSGQKSISESLECEGETITMHSPALRVSHGPDSRAHTKQPSQILLPRIQPNTNTTESASHVCVQFHPAS
jgi:hypothetical protein